jgi:hypothetical protein
MGFVGGSVASIVFVVPGLDQAVVRAGRTHRLSRQSGTPSDQHSLPPTTKTRCGMDGVRPSLSACTPSRFIDASTTSAGPSRRIANVVARRWTTACDLSAAARASGSDPPLLRFFPFFYCAKHLYRVPYTEAHSDNPPKSAICNRRLRS